MKNDLPIDIDELNLHFSQIGRHHLDQFKTSSEEFTNSMNDCPTTMFCFPASDCEILKIISLENNNKVARSMVSITEFWKFLQ